MVRTLQSLVKDIQDYFGYRKQLHFGFGRKINPVYVVNRPKSLKCALIDQAIVQNDWYTVFSSDTPVLVTNILVLQDTADETIQVEIVVDNDVELTQSAACTAGTTYFVGRSLDADGAVGATGSVYMILSGDEYRQYSFPNLRVRIKKTTAAGANNTCCKVIYQDD